MPNVLYSLHDREAAFQVPSGGWVVDTIALSEYPKATDYTALRADVNWLVRVNWGYGSTGTIPQIDEINKYIWALGKYAAESRGAHSFIVGNEPNHEGERPNGIVITPGHYIECFVRARELLKTLNSANRVIPAPLAPYHASPMDWLFYMKTMWNLIEQRGGADGVAIHAYTRSTSRFSIRSGEKMAAPLLGQFSGFKTYQDALSAIPTSLRSLPAYITEFNPIPDWENVNTGLIEEAYQEVADWNGVSTQKIHCLTLFRWNSYPGQRWGIQDKPNVIQDFMQSTQRALFAPQTPVPIADGSTSKPKVVPSTIEAPQGSQTTVTTAVVRDIDIRATKRGVSVVENPQAVWKVVKIQWLDEAESQGRHHFYFDTLDEKGGRIAGVPIQVSWPTGSTVVTSEEKKGESYSANFPLSPSRNEFSAMVYERGLSEMVRGVGMGADTPTGFNAGHHTSTFVVFQKEMPIITPKPVPPVELKPIPALFHPVFELKYRKVTQGWGENPAIYSRFKVDGVPLKGHNGLDFATPLGSRIVAVYSGKAVEVANDPGGFGLYVKLVHSWGESLYAHLQSQSVITGATVSAGQEVGLSGNTGFSTGPHLHFGMRVNPYNRQDGWGGYSDPGKYLGGGIVSPPVPTSPIGAIRIAAKETGLEWQLLASLAWAESSFRPEIPDGLFQIGDATWSDWADIAGATNRNDALDNAKVGAYYLRWLINYLKGDIHKSLIAWNFGIGNVISDEEPPAITLEFVNKVLHGRDLLKVIGA